MKRSKLLIILLLALVQHNVNAAQPLWQEADLAQRSMSQKLTSDRYFKSDAIAIKQVLSRAAAEGVAGVDSRIELPLPDGHIEQFQLSESPVMAPGLAAKYPQIKTYQVSGIDHPNITGRLSYTDKGFSAMIASSAFTYYLDPAGDGLFRGYGKDSLTPSQPFNCGVKDHNTSTPLSSTTGFAARTAQRVPGSMMVYRLALAAASEYVSAVGGTKAAALSEMVTTINRVNEIYQRDLGIKLELVNNNDEIIYAVGTQDDPYSDPPVLDPLLEENQNTLDAVIGSANYDIGHVFSIGGGGIASVGSVCASNFKAQGATGLQGAVGDAFYIDYVAHEMGHQFGATHTFNGTTGSCGGANRSADSAFEPGSGSTIMAYAGLCNNVLGDENVQTHSDALFHAGSLAQIHEYTTLGYGKNCGSLQSITNNPGQPVITPASDYTIPANTPFRLSASASDPDNDSLSYAWDEMDAGTATTSSTFGLDLGDNALFRSYLPRVQAERYFPRLDQVLNGTTNKSEKLPATTRSLNFTITVRDGKGGQAQDSQKISVIDTTAFTVTSHKLDSTISNPTTSRLVTWEKGSTDNLPIACTKVNIDLLKLNASKASYCEQRLLSATANDGIAAVSLPDENIPFARFKVSCANNIFYALSEGDLTITGAVDADVSCKSVIADNLDQVSTPIDVDPNNSVSRTPVASSGGGALSVYGMLGLFLLVGFRNRFCAHEKACTMQARKTITQHDYQG